jgi:hypothetical protein
VKSNQGIPRSYVLCPWFGLKGTDGESRKIGALFASTRGENKVVRSARVVAKMQESQSGHAVISMGGMKSAGTSRMQCYTQVPEMALRGIKEATSISALPEATQPSLSHNESNKWHAWRPRS